nr:MAG TPA: hypothetical protein [Bacteriophage sp.]
MRFFNTIFYTYGYTFSILKFNFYALYYNYITFL